MLASVIALLMIAGVAVAGFYAWQAVGQRRARRAKNIERGLKMVTLLIHLPPHSEDTDVGGRDVRDVTEENISKAQILYNIIASTLQKGFKARKFGQRHFSFEIVGMHGFVYFYASVPVALEEVVRQAVISAYPSARLEEAPDHNIFSQVGKVNGVVGGEFALKESFAYPIATYQDSKRDAIQALLNALGNLEKQDGAAIQFLIRPADPSWRKQANTLADKKKKGTDKKKSFIENVAWGIKQILIALSQPPDTKDDKSKELSSLDQSIVDAIYDKTRSPGFEVLIRVVVSSNISQRSQALLGNITASFSLFDAPGKNGFKFTSFTPHELVQDYVLRRFPQNANDTILNAVELATLFHFPDQRSTPTSQLERQDSKQVDGPRNVPDEGLLLGYNVFRGVKKPIRLALQDRQRHMYVVGQTGTGKSTFLENLALQDMLQGGGFAFVDPHGDTAENLLAMVPKERTEDVIYFCPAETDYPLGLNLFEHSNDDQKDFLIQEVLNMLYKLYDPQRQGIMGPRYEDMFRNAALLVMADPNGGTLIEIPQLFRNPDFLKQKLQHVKDQPVLDFWTKQYPAQQRSNEAGEVTAWFVSKFGAFLNNAMMRNIIGQNQSAFDLRKIMDEGKILIVNLSKGRTGDLNSKLLGMIFVMRFQAAAMSRANIPEKDRKDFALYVDEFQNFSTDSFATIMSEARKYHLNLIVANQFTTQLTDEIRDAVFGNMGTVVSFRVGQNDVDGLSRYFQPQFDADDLLRVPNYNTITRTLIGGVPTQPFSMATLPPLGSPNPKLAAALRQLSAAKYGKPKQKVEDEIFARLRTTAPSTPTFGQQRSPFGTPPAAASAGSPFSRPATGSVPPVPATKPAGSFLDDWLAKKRVSAGAPGPGIPAGQSPMQARPVSAPQQPVQPSQGVSVSTTEGEVSLRSDNPSIETNKPADQAVLDQVAEEAAKSPNEPTVPAKEEDTIYIDRDGNLRQKGM